MSMNRKLILLFCLTSVLLGPVLARRPAREGKESDLRFAALQDVSSGPKPTVLLKTDQVVYLVGDPILLSVDMEPNGHLFNKTFFAYLQNMQTGEFRYLNNQSGLQLVGTITDIGGSTVANVEAFPIPTVQDFPLIGPGGLFAGSMTASADLLGNHRFVLELRDVTGKRVFQRTSTDFVIVTSVEELPAEITTNTTLTSDQAYLLNNRATFVRSGATLTIEPGTYLLGTGIGTLVVDRDARIFADGTSARPIVMTSSEPVGQRQTQDWGGLILNGNAPVNVPGGVGEGEGDTGQFGGDDPDDSSGVLRYVRVEFAGIEFSPENELNGIAFQGVGRGTVVEHIQVHFNKDDGVEFFGGTVNVKYVLLTSNADDSLDWTEGWTGKAQFVVAQQNKLDADQGIEADNNAENNELTPRSNPTIFNITLIGGNPLGGTTEESDIGILLREGTAASIYNSIVTGFGQQGVVIDQDASIAQAEAGNLRVGNSIISGNATRDTQRGEAGRGSNVTSNFDVLGFLDGQELHNRVAGVDPMLRDPFNLISPDYRPKLESPALDVNFVRNPPDDGFFTPVHFIGGVDPFNDWTVGWTTHSPN